MEQSSVGYPLLLLDNETLAIYWETGISGLQI